MEPLQRFDDHLPRPRREEFVDPFNHKGWLEYFENLLPRFRYVRFVGLPSLKDVPDVPLERLYVPLHLGSRYVAPGAEAEQGERIDVGEALERSRHLVVLGDPGSGKSTLTSFLVTAFASRRTHPLGETLGPLIPVPFVLRDFTVDAEITFDGLLDQLLAERYWSPKLDRRDLVAALERGQGLVLLDGLDEIGDLGRRRALRRAVVEGGVARFPSSCWLLTSRVVGYEEVPFDQALDPADAGIAGSGRVWLRDRSRRPIPFPVRHYLLPFDLEQIRRFAENWYALREADPAERKSGVESLLAAIQASPSIERLAHTPNLLQMMALIHRVYAQLPSGRALLYDRIAEAYLESIDASRKIRESPVPASLQRRWLGSLAYDLQLQRAQGGADASEILVPEGEVEQQIRNALGPEVDAARELAYVARRSGLLLPRKPGFFTFVHLSFQEYFAACHLYERLMGFETRDETAQEVTELAGEPGWHESLVFLFEKLSQHQGASNWLFRQLFPEGREAGAEVLLAADLLRDLHSGLSEESLKLGAALVLRAGMWKYREPLVDALDALPQGPRRWLLHAEIEQRVAGVEPLRPDALLFLQNLTLLDWDRLEALLSASVLERIEAEDLYFLHPMAWRSKGPVFQALVLRLPMELWLAPLWGDAPLVGLLPRELPTGHWERGDLLAWAAASYVSLWSLLIKSLLAGWAKAEPARVRALSRDRAVAQAQDRALKRARDEDRSLRRALDLHQALNRARDRDQVSALPRALVRALGRALDEARPWFPGTAQDSLRDLDAILALGREISRGVIGTGGHARVQTLALVLDRDRVRALTENTEVRRGRTLHLLTAFLSGDDALTPLPPEPKSAEARPGLLILHHLGRLVLGQGGPDDWRRVEEQADVLADPAWVQEHFPFLRPDEMETVLRLLGLRMDDGKALFDAEWFAPGHPLAPALNARPSEFVARIEKLALKGA